MIPEQSIFPRIHLEKMEHAKDHLKSLVLIYLRPDAFLKAMKEIDSLSPLVIALVPLKCSGSIHLVSSFGALNQGENTLVPLPFQKKKQTCYLYENVLKL